MNYSGLTNKQVEINREKYGTNELTKMKKDSFIKKLLITFSDPIIKILLIALALKVIFLFKDFDWYETIGIVIAILLASLISTISEYGSEKAFEKLQEEASQLKCKVIRDGKIREVAISDVVKVISLDRNSFKRLLGPIEPILQRNIEKYQKFVVKENDENENA